MAFQEKLKENQKPLNDYVHSVVFHKEDANDIVQNTNKILITKQADYNSDLSFLSWAITIARFQIKAYLSKRKRSREVLDPCDENSLMGEDFLSNTPFSYLIEEERMKIIRKINAILGPKEAVIFDLLSKGYNLAEMREETNLSYGAVNALKRRVINKIKNLISNVKNKNDYDFR